MVVVAGQPLLPPVGGPRDPLGAVEPRVPRVAEALLRRVAFVDAVAVVHVASLKSTKVVCVSFLIHNFREDFHTTS